MLLRCSGTGVASESERGWGVWQRGRWCVGDAVQLQYIANMQAVDARCAGAR